MPYMGLFRLKLQTTLILAIVGIVPFSAQALTATIETFQPFDQINRLQSDTRPTADNSTGDAIEPAQKRNSDPLRYAVAFTGLVFVSLIFVFIFLMRRQRRSDQ